MGKRDDLKAALERRTPAGAVPIWEIEFHAWDAASGRHVVLGHEFAALTPGEQEKAMAANTGIDAMQAIDADAPDQGHCRESPLPVREYGLRFAPQRPTGGRL